jgi:predicted ester cyclase
MFMKRRELEDWRRSDRRGLVGDTRRRYHRGRHSIPVLGYAIRTWRITVTDLERDLGRRWFEEVWNEGRREAIAEMLAPGAVIHDGGTDTAGAEGFYPFYDRLHGAFSEIHVEVQDSFAESDKICVRWSCTGKHTGDALGVEPTGAAVDVTGMSILRVANGKLAEGWQNWDMLGLMAQIAGMPGPRLISVR